MPPLVVDAGRTLSYPENLLTNGGFENWQRGTGPFTAHKSFHADEWNLGVSGATATVTRESGTVKLGSYSCKVDVSAITVDPSIRAGIEAYKSLEGLWVTFSCWVYAPAANSVQLEIHDWDGTNEDATGQSNTTSGQWEQLTVSKQIRTGLIPSTTYFPNLWPHDYGIVFRVRFKQTGIYYVDSAMVVPGYYPEGVAYTPIPASKDFKRCQRYYEKCESSNAWRGILWDLDGDYQWVDDGRVDFVRRFAVAKAATPAISGYSFAFAVSPRSPSYGIANVNNEGFHWYLSENPPADDHLYLVAAVNGWVAEVA